MTPEERRRIAELEPSTRAAYEDYRADCEAAGLRLCAIVTYRSPRLQAVKRAEGKSTLAVGWHQLRRAIDEQIYDPEARAWDHKARRVDLYRLRARIAGRHGFRQLGFSLETGKKRYLSTGAWDPYHIEWRAPHATLRAALKAEAPELIA